MHRCKLLLILLLLLTAPASSQEQRWLITLKDSADVDRAMLLRRNGDALFILRTNREALPISSILSLRPQFAGQTALPIMIGAAAGGVLGYALGQAKGMWPVALGGLVGGLMGALKGSSDTPTYRLDSLDQAGKYALIDSLIELNDPERNKYAALANVPREGEETSDGSAVVEKTSSPVDRFTICPFGTFALPVGTFGAKGGSAITGAGSGWGLGCEVTYGLTPELSCIGSASVAFHIPKAAGSDRYAAPVSIGSYLLAWPMAGMRWSGYRHEDQEFFVDAMIGALYQRSPEINSLGRTDFIRVESSYTTTLAYSFGVGWTLNGLTRCALRYRNGGSPVFDTAELVNVYEWDPTHFTRSMRSIYQPVAVKQPTAVMELSIEVIL